MAIDDEIPRFEASLSRLVSLLGSVPESLVHIKPKPDDWSVKEIACHLVDSASNNHQRFTHLQRTPRLTFPAYVPEPWVAVEKPQTLDWSTLLTLVKAYNAFVLHLVRNLDSACLANVWVIDGQEKTLEFLARDYYRHLDWHFEHLQKRLEEVKALYP
jgi:hypothetical protein